MPWDPLHELMTIHDRGHDRRANGAAWVPPVDLYEVASGYVLVAELPGCGPGDFTVDVTADALTLSGRRRALDVKCEQYLRVERGHGDFTRAFTFPNRIDVSGIDADFHDGLLRITIPKAGQPSARRIEIR